MDLNRLRHVERRIKQGVFVRKDMLEVIKDYREVLEKTPAPGTPTQPSIPVRYDAPARCYWEPANWQNEPWMPVAGKHGATYIVGAPAPISGNAIIGWNGTAWKTQ